MTIPWYNLLPRWMSWTYKRKEQEDGTTGEIHALLVNEEKRCAMMGYVVKDLDEHLYKELMEGLRCGM